MTVPYCIHVRTCSLESELIAFRIVDLLSSSAVSRTTAGYVQRMSNMHEITYRVSNTHAVIIINTLSMSIMYPSLSLSLSLSHT